MGGFCAVPGGGHQDRGEGYLQGFLPPSPDLCGMSIVGVPREGPHTGQAPGTIYVLTLEGLSGDHAGGTVPLATVPKL